MGRKIAMFRAAPLRLLGLLLAALSTLAIPARAGTVVGTLGVDPSQVAGTDSGGRVLLFAPSPLQPGSSISHWDTSAFPNLLLEPSINSDLMFGKLDLTLFQLRDIGWPSGNSNMTLRIQDSAGQGFDGPVSGAARRAAMERALTIYESRLQSSIEINVGVSFSALTCGGGTGALAQAGAEFLFESFAGAPMTGTWYHGALAESLASSNLSLQDTNNPDAGDLALTFNSQVDNACLGSGSRFYYGLDGNVPSGQISFVAVALHELAHGLGFATFTDASSGSLFGGKPDIYSRFIFDNDLGRTWNQMTDAQRRASAVNSRRVAWSGNQVRSQAPNFLRPGPALLIDSPASLAGSYEVGTAQFGPPVTTRGVTGAFVEARDSSSAPELLCLAVANGAEVTGKIALVDRGECNFTVKVKNAQNAGATAVVVINNIDGSPPGMGGTDSTITIPSVSISRDDGALIRTALQQTSNPGLLAFTDSVFTVDEAQGSARITVRRVGGRDGEVSVDLMDLGGTATEGEDYAAVDATVTFADGQGGIRAFEIEILNDLEIEGNETLLLALVGATGGAEIVEPTESELVLIDDDVSRSGILEFSAARFQVLEGNAATSITVERSGGSTGAVSVSYATGGGTAEPETDYSPVIGTLDFADGEEGSRSFEIPLFDDEQQESIETVGLALSNVTGGALLGEQASALLDIIDDEPCEPGDSRLCLEQQRFRVEVRWRDFEDGEGVAMTQALDSDDSGLFWFFDSDNLEMLVKVLDGCGVNGHFWVFAAAVTNVEYTLYVTDTSTGQFKQYLNPLGLSSPAITDTEAFSTCSAASLVEEAPDGYRLSSKNISSTAESSPSGFSRQTRNVPLGDGVCENGSDSICLNNDRFEARIRWKDFDGNAGSGQVEPLDSNDSGLFWFFARDNLEMLVKVLDGCGINDRFWIFAAATTNVEYTLTVTDTETGEIREYLNTLGTSSPAITDTDAFATCP